MQDKYIAAVLGGFAAGIFLHSFIDFGVPFSTFLLLLGLIFLIDHKQHVVLFVACVLIGGGLGLLRYDFAQAPLSITLATQQKIAFRALVTDEPNQKDQQQQLTVALRRKNASEATPAVRVLITVPSYPAYAYGDALEVYGELLKPQNFADTFDWVGYLEKEGISYQMFRPSIQLLGHDQGNPLKTKLLIK